VRKLLVISITLASVAVLLGQVNAQQEEERVRHIAPRNPIVADADVNSQPIPRLPDGTIDITGPWFDGGSNGDIERDGGLKPGELPLLPWAKELRDKRLSKDEPYTACLPMGVPRHNPYPWTFAMSYTSKGLSHIYVLHETGDAGAHRVVYMDGRTHPADLLPTWWGHSIGRFEKDTLVIDTIGYNDKFWFDSRGTPHTEQLHTVERWTRINFGRMTNQFTIDDPGAFSRPVTLNFLANHVRQGLKVGGDLMEFICLEDNQYGAAAQIEVGSGK
jgi:hypothetical protein